MLRRLVKGVAGLLAVAVCWEAVAFARAMSPGGGGPSLLEVQVADEGTDRYGPCATGAGRRRAR